MAKDSLGLRRRAAVAVLSDLLDDNTLLQELWVQHDTMRGDGVKEIIDYVDGAALRHMFDAATCKRLYSAFFAALRQPEDTLPLDPWPAMQSLRPAVAMPSAGLSRAAPARVARFSDPAFAVAAPAYVAVEPAQPVVPMPAPVPQAVAAPAAAPAEEPPAVFGALMRTVVEELARFHAEALAEVRNDALRVLAGSPAPAELREQFGRAWSRAELHDWKLQGQPADLAELTRVVHQALEMAFGRIGADQILQRAVLAADQLPQARQFSAKRLLAAL